MKRKGLNTELPYLGFRRADSMQLMPRGDRKTAQRGSFLLKCYAGVAEQVDDDLNLVAGIQLGVMKRTNGRCSDSRGRAVVHTRRAMTNHASAMCQLGLPSGHTQPQAAL